MSTLAKPAPEINDFSLLVLADLATEPTTGRRHQRIGTLMGSHLNVNGGGVPGFITAMETAGLVQITRTLTGTRKDRRQTGWNLTLTDKGLSLHRSLMASLQNAHA